MLTIAASINLDIDPKEFALQLSSEAINHNLMTEIHQVQALPIQGFPSLVLEHNGSLSPIPLDYLDYQTSYRHLINGLNNGLNKMK
ncbi:conserved protein of unknown function, might belong to Thioredoxin [Shewanella benthica]|uniref:Uncharacterized protein n=1 Tax=Shewanella benthica TaxID=43661 RepID=A0A330M4W3_9GAMM|nr:hypothetical protein [Shewanella benthica]SQH76483.1 conserved protein of unknown function, might belong to Thioredoxin [Shewanella benthica]